MPIDRNFWTRWYAEGRDPAWPCPTCTGGKLSAVEGSFAKKWDAATQRNSWSDDYAEASGRFSCLLSCDHCKEAVALVGFMACEQVHDSGHPEWTDIFRPLFFSPPVPLFRISERCIDPIRNEIRAAFGLVYADPASCANRVRSAVEAILTQQGIPRSVVHKKRHWLTAHQRIEQFKKRNLELGDALLAIKWIGNAGSHSSEISQADIFDAFDILEHVLDRLYVRSDKQIQRLAKEINKRRGPRKAK